MTTFAELNTELQATKAELETVNTKLLDVESMLLIAQSSLGTREHELRMAEVRETTLRSEVARLEALVRGITDPLWDRLVVAQASIATNAEHVVQFANDIIARRTGRSERVRVSKKNKSDTATPT